MSIINNFPELVNKLNNIEEYLLQTTYKNMHTIRKPCFLNKYVQFVLSISRVTLSD